jgi:hypothetical protein
LFKFKKTAAKVTSSEDTSDKSKSSKEKSSDSFKSAEGGFESPKNSMLNWSLDGSFGCAVVNALNQSFEYLLISLNCILTWLVSPFNFQTH